MKNRPSAAQAAEFDRYVAKWQDILALGTWRIERSTKPAPRGAMAAVMFNDGARLATTMLGDFAGEEINPDSLERTALHEVLHVLLHDLIAMAGDARASDVQLEAAEHQVINVLERVLYAGAKSIGG